MKPNFWQKLFLPDNDPRTIPSLSKRIQRYAAGADYHLANLKYVLQDLEYVKKMLLDLQDLEIATTAYEAEKIPYNQEYQHLEKLLDRWPNAIPTKDICKKENDLIDRANSIVDLYLGKFFLEDLKFLDFGCGDGLVVDATLRENPKIAVGYDIKESPNWKFLEKDKKILTTTDIEKVQSLAPYDVIMAFDVLDHLENDQPSRVVKILSELLAPQGTLFIRCHPWTSRHGTHLYDHNFNKAYAHIIFDDVELARLGYQNNHTLKITNPIQTYRQWFLDADLLIKEENPTFSEIENFFFRPEFVKRIRKHWTERNYLIIPDEILNIEFIDFELEKIRSIL